MKKAFTLAEVLITLGVIGVVAALTIPNILIKHQKMETVTRLKKAYSIVSQTIKLSETENDEVKFWDLNLNGHAFFEKYIKKYVKYTQEFTSQELATLVKRIDIDGKDYDGLTYDPNSNAATHFILADGTLVTINGFYYLSNNHIWVGIDVNGLKKPNQIGKDTFLFVFSTEHGLQPLGGPGTDNPWSYGTYDRNKILSQGNNNCNKTYSNGFWCTAIIMNDGWEIKDDYPW